MLDCVPEPVCQTTRGKCSVSAPLATSAAALVTAASFFSVIFSGLSSWLALAAAPLSIPKAFIISSGIVSSPTPIRKLLRLLSVCAPQYLSAGTLTSPIESCSVRYSISYYLVSSLIYLMSGQKSLPITDTIRT